MSTTYVRALEKQKISNRTTFFFRLTSFSFSASFPRMVEISGSAPLQKFCCQLKIFSVEKKTFLCARYKLVYCCLNF